MINVKEMELVGGKLLDMDFVVGGNEMGVDMMGIFGCNIFVMMDIEYDFVNGVICLMFLKGDCSEMFMVYWVGDKFFFELWLLWDELWLKLLVVKVVVEFNGRKFSVLFDIGVSLLVLLVVVKCLGIIEVMMKLVG